MVTITEEIQKTGNSYFFRIKKSIAKILKAEKGDAFEITIKKIKK